MRCSSEMFSVGIILVLFATGKALTDAGVSLIAGTIFQQSKYLGWIIAEDVLVELGVDVHCC